MFMRTLGLSPHSPAERLPPPTFAARDKADRSTSNVRNGSFSDRFERNEALLCTEMTRWANNEKTILTTREYSCWLRSAMGLGRVKTVSRVVGSES
jgi:hypothetical protein